MKFCLESRGIFFSFCTALCKSLADVQLMKHLSGLVKNHTHFMKITPSGSESIELDMINDLTLAPSSAQKNLSPRHSIIFCS